MKKALFKTVSVYIEKAYTSYIIIYKSGRKRTFYLKYDIIPESVHDFINTGILKEKVSFPNTGGTEYIYINGRQPERRKKGRYDTAIVSAYIPPLTKTEA